MAYIKIREVKCKVQINIKSIFIKKYLEVYQMTRAECAERRKIMQNMAWYLGVDYAVPECSAVKCPEGECDRLKNERHNLTNAYVQPLDEKQRDEVRKDHLNMNQYSFFSSDDYDRLGKKAPTISFDYLQDCLKRLNGEEPSETTIDAEHKETDSSAEISLDEYLKNHKLSSEPVEEHQDNNEPAEASEASEPVELAEASEVESDEVKSDFTDNNDDDVDTSSVVVYTLDDNEDDLINSDEADEV